MERLYRVKQHHLTNHIRKSLISLVTRINIVISTINPCIPEFLTCHQSMWNSPSVSGSCHQEAECRCLFIFHDGKHHEVQHCYGLPGMPNLPPPDPQVQSKQRCPQKKATELADLSRVTAPSAVLGIQRCFFQMDAMEP